MELVPTLAGIAWDPEIRGILSVLVGVVVLMGSVYLLLATNVASRLGFLLSLAAVFGWMTIHGLTWWIYPPGQGPIGDIPSWHVEEIVYGDLSNSMLEEAHQVDVSQLPALEDLEELEPADMPAVTEENAEALGDWELLAPADPSRGEAQTTLDAVLAEGVVPGLEETTSRVYTFAFETGGKPERASDSVWDRVTNRITNTFRTNPPHYMIVQLQPASVEPAEPGAPPNQPEIIEDSQTVSAVLIRDIGERRLLPAGITIGSGMIFGVLCVMLHKRDQKVIAHRSAPTPASAGG